MESGMNKARVIYLWWRCLEQVKKPNDNWRHNDDFSDDPCIQELQTRSKIHLFYPRWQRHTVLERMVWNSCYWKLFGDMSSKGHIALKDSSPCLYLKLHLSYQLQELCVCVCVCVCVRARAHVIMTKCGPGAIVFLSLDRFVSVQWDQN